MKQKFCAVMSVLCIVFMLGIIGGIDDGQPLINLVWCFPAALLAWVFAVVGNLTDY